MINEKIFRAYDIRGVYPKEINPEIISLVVDCLVKIYKKDAPKKSWLKVVIGYDARLSSPFLYSAALKAFKKFSKIKVIEGGIMTTPMIYFLINYLKADGGIIITASHNPLKYNGLKMSKKNAEPLNGLQILKILKKDKTVKLYKNKI
jgi:phosphomannomutase